MFPVSSPGSPASADTRTGFHWSRDIRHPVSHIRGTVWLEVSWQVTGIRKDAWAEKNRIPGEVAKTGEERGKYIHPEVFGQPAEKGIDYKRSQDAKTRSRLVD